MDRIDIAVELAKRVYFEHAAGGALHICLDDGNLSVENFRWCLYDLDGTRTWAEQECGEYWRSLTEAEMQTAYLRREEYQTGDAHKSSFGGDLDVAR